MHRHHLLITALLIIALFALVLVGSIVLDRDRRRLYERRSAVRSVRLLGACREIH